MERNEIISKLCKEAAETTPDLFDKISSAAKAQGLVQSGGAPSGAGSAANGGGAVKSAVKTVSKGKIAAIAAGTLAVLLAVTAVAVPLALDSGSDVGGNGGLDSAEGNDFADSNDDGSTGTSVASAGLKYVLSEDGTFYECAGFSGEPFADVVIASEYEGLPVKGIASMAFYYPSDTVRRNILTSVIIPDSVTYIESGAFNSCESLAKITIPDSVTCIADRAFAACHKLESLTLPNGLSEITEYAFSGLWSLTNLVIPDGITTIEKGGVSDCSVIESITLPDSVTAIGEGAFMFCGALESINIPEGTTTIGKDAFRYCASLKNLNIPKNVTEIGECVVGSCEALESLTVNSANSVYYSVSNCIIDKASKTLIAGSNNSSIPNDGSVTSIGSNAFYGCVFESISLPQSINSIGEEAFSCCLSLKSINLPEALTAIANKTFYECRSLESIIIPANVKVIGVNAFNSCSKLASVTLNNVTMIDEGAFSLSGLTEIDIPSSVTEIGDLGFYGTAITEIVIPATVTKLGARVFADSENLTKAAVYSSSIGNGTFDSCLNLQDVYISNNLKVSYSDNSFNSSFFIGSNIREITFGGTFQELNYILMYWGNEWSSDEINKAEYVDYVTVHCSDDIVVWLKLDIFIY